MANKHSIRAAPLAILLFLLAGCGGGGAMPSATEITDLGGGIAMTADGQILVDVPGLRFSNRTSAAEASR